MWKWRVTWNHKYKYNSYFYCAPYSLTDGALQKSANTCFTAVITSESPHCCAVLCTSPITMESDVCRLQARPDDAQPGRRCSSHWALQSFGKPYIIVYRTEHGHSHKSWVFSSDSKRCRRLGWRAGKLVGTATDVKIHRTWSILPPDRGLRRPPASFRSRQRPHCSENKQLDLATGVSRSRVREFGTVYPPHYGSLTLNLATLNDF